MKLLSACFACEQVLKGLDLSLFDMCIGERRKIEIPARLAYGLKGSKLFRVPPDDGKVNGPSVSLESPIP